MLGGSKGSNGYSLNNSNFGRNLFSDISHLSPRPNAGIKRRRSVRLEREVRWRTRLLREGTLRALTNATHLGKELHCAVLPVAKEKESQRLLRLPHMSSSLEQRVWEGRRTRSGDEPNDRKSTSL